MSNERTPFTIGMVLFPDLTQLDLTGPYEVFARMPQTRTLLVAETAQPVRSERGLAILPDTTLAAPPPFDLLFVPGGIGVNAMMEHAPLLDFLRAQADLGCVVEDADPDLAEADAVFATLRAWDFEISHGALLDTHRDQLKDTVVARSYDRGGSP